MKRITAMLLALMAGLAGCGHDPHSATGRNGMVATVHPIATEAALRVMRQGGNAVDAAIEAALVLGVVDGHNSGIGGGCFMLVRLADGRLFCLDGRETAPARASRDMFVRNGTADPALSQTGPLAVGVPGSLAVYDYASREFGRRTLAALIEPAAQIAEDGFRISETYAKNIAEKKSDLQRFAGTRAVLFKADRSPYQAGEVLRQPDLAGTYRAIGREGIGYFYGGPFAEAVGNYMRESGGVVTREDFARYSMRMREPLVSRYRGYTIIGFPPPSSGGVHVAEILNILGHFPIGSLAEAERVHVTAEAMKRAFADRAYWLGDPDFVQVPRGLVDEAYAGGLAAGIDMSHATSVEHGEPPGAEFFGKKHTTHIATADAAGNVVALTCTVNTTFGSKVIVPGTGVILNDQMDDFASQAGAPNHFKLVGSEANAVAPGKRPLSSMSPTIVMKDGRVVMTIGAAGGPKIISDVVLGISNVIDLGDDAKRALRRKRYHDQWSPDEVMVEKGTGAGLIVTLRAKGHKVVIGTEGMGSSQMIVSGSDGILHGACEPRGDGEAAGY